MSTAISSKADFTGVTAPSGNRKCSDANHTKAGVSRRVEGWNRAAQRKVRKMGNICPSCSTTALVSLPPPERLPTSLTQGCTESQHHPLCSRNMSTACTASPGDFPSRVTVEKREHRLEVKHPGLRSQLSYSHAVWF